MAPKRGLLYSGPLFTTPYTEDDVAGLVKEAGAENALFDSGSPHGEGLAEPLSYGDLIADLSEADAGRVIRRSRSEMIAL